MKDKLYLVVNRRGVDRMTKRAPSMKAGEVAVRLTVEVDDVHFRTPFAEATVAIGEGHLIQPEVEVEVEEPEGEVDEAP